VTGKQTVCAARGIVNPKRTVQHIINEGISRKSGEVTIPPGTYYCANPISFDAVRGLTISGEGVRLIMTDYRESGLVFNNCAGITLKGFSMDYDPLPFTQATVVSRNADATEFEFEVHEGYRDFEVTGRLGLGSRAEVFDPGSMLWKIAPDFRGGDVVPIEKHAISPRRGHIKLSTATPSLEPGNYLALVSRERDIVASAIEFQHCSTVRLEDLTVLASPSFAVYCAAMDGENYFRHIVARGPQDRYGVRRLLSTNADGLHYHGGRRGPIVERCDFSFMSDDAVNINGPSFVVKEIENQRTLIVEANEFNAVCLPSVTKGDTIRFMSAENYDITAEARIEAIGEIREIAEVTDDRIRLGNDYAGGLFKRGRTARISCDRPLELSGNEYCSVFNLNCPGFVIRDSYFHDHRAMGLRIFGTDGIIENNRIERTKLAAVNVGPAWFGSHDGWGKNITIRGNTISDVPFSETAFQGAIAVSAAKMPNSPITYRFPRCTRDIVIENNMISDCGASGIFVNAADGVRVRGNHIRGSNQKDCSSLLETTGVKAEYAIDVQNSSHVEITDNKVEQPGKFCAGDKRGG